VEYTEPVSFNLDGLSFEWTPEEGLLADKDDFEANAQEQTIQAFVDILVNEYGENFPATPEGPYLPTTLTDLRTTVYLLNVMFPSEKMKITGEHPTMASLGLGKGTRSLEDGSEVVD